MNHYRILFILLIITGLFSFGPKKQTISIILPKHADKIETLAAEDLCRYLRKIYPTYDFSLSTTGQSAPRIFIGKAEHLPVDLMKNLPISENQEGFVISSSGAETAIITSSGSKGVLYGVYELLQKLGYSFLYSGDFAPLPKAHFNFETWNFSNEPLLAERTVFNWHNFLSGCSAWDFEDWVTWIEQSQKMGYNTIMVHGYANNPMFSFEFEGITKRVGYLSSSNNGRDWSTEHVNDVRRLPGGAVFDYPVFGSEAAKVPDEARVSAAQDLMGRVFQYAEDRGMHISFALDFDIVAAIPQEMIAKIPVSDKFSVYHKGIAWMGEKPGRVELPRPDKPGGYEYYKRQVETVLKLYPQIDKYVLWKRASNSVYQELKLKDLPSDWQKEYSEIIKEKPEVANYRQATGNFAQGKLAGAYRQAFDELGGNNIGIAFGTWRWWPLKAMNEFYPDYATVYILDSEIIRGDEHLHNQTTIDTVASWVKAGRLIPVIWPHHDDGAYVGAPLAPFENFYHTLSKLKSSGFGLIHWMTRPFDLFFIHHSKQTWKTTANQALSETLADLGEKWFGHEHAEIMTKYLKLYTKDMPTFGRETIPAFIDKAHFHKFEKAAEVIAKSEERIELLKSVDTTLFSEDQKQTYLYFLNFEDFVKKFYHQQDLYLSCLKKREEGNIREAETLATQFAPEEVLEQFSKTIQFGQTSKGEKGLLFSMGVRWVPHFYTVKQQLGLSDIKINFGTTVHEDLAQMPGFRTYFVDEEGAYWLTLGEKETGKKVVSNLGKSGILYEGIIIDSTSKVAIHPFTSTSKLSKGKYEIKLLSSSTADHSKLKIKILGSTYEASVNDSFEIELDGKSNPVLEFLREGEIILSGMVLKKK